MEACSQKHMKACSSWCENKLSQRKFGRRHLRKIRNQMPRFLDYKGVVALLRDATMATGKNASWGKSQ